MIDLTACRSINAYPQASYPSTFYTTFSTNTRQTIRFYSCVNAPNWNGGSLPNASQSIGTIKINPFTYRAKEGKAISTALRLRGKETSRRPLRRSLLIQRVTYTARMQ